MFATDLSIHKIFPINERLRFTFRFEVQLGGEISF